MAGLVYLDVKLDAKSSMSILATSNLDCKSANGPPKELSAPQGHLSDCMGRWFLDKSYVKLADIPIPQT